MDVKLLKCIIFSLVLLVPLGASATSLDDAATLRPGFDLSFAPGTGLSPYAEFIDTDAILQFGLFDAPITLGSDLTLELAGYANGNEFGVQEVGGGTTAIFSGPQGAGASSTLELDTGTYSFYIDPKYGSPTPYSAIDDNNWDNTAHIVGAQINKAGTLNISGLQFALNVGDYFLFMEDLPFGGDKDYNDMVVIMRSSGGDTEVPEPGTALLLASGIFGLGFRKKIKK